MIPRLPQSHLVTIAEATEDCKSGYDFEISSIHGDFGHFFPAKIIKTFDRSSPIVKGNIRRTLRSKNRFWSVNWCTSEIDEIISSKEEELQFKQRFEDRTDSILANCFSKAFDDKKFSQDIYNKMNEHFDAVEWEYALVHGLTNLFPYYDIERRGAPEEANHGTDILVKIPNLFSEKPYAVAIQVKDYSTI